jgi:hypothetical protein
MVVACALVTVLLHSTESWRACNCSARHAAVAAAAAGRQPEPAASMTQAGTSSVGEQRLLQLAVAAGTWAQALAAVVQKISQGDHVPAMTQFILDVLMLCCIAASTVLNATTG